VLASVPGFFRHPAPACLAEGHAWGHWRRRVRRNSRTTPVPAPARLGPAW